MSLKYKTKNYHDMSNDEKIEEEIQSEVIIGEILIPFYTLLEDHQIYGYFEFITNLKFKTATAKVKLIIMDSNNITKDEDSCIENKSNISKNLVK